MKFPIKTGMTLKELKEWVDYIAEDPATLKHKIVIEPKSEWKHYTMGPGFATRHQSGKDPVIVWRLK